MDYRKLAGRSGHYQFNAWSAGNDLQADPFPEGRCDYRQDSWLAEHDSEGEVMEQVPAWAVAIGAIIGLVLPVLLTWLKNDKKETREENRHVETAPDADPDELADIDRMQDNPPASPFK